MARNVNIRVKIPPPKRTQAGKVMMANLKRLRKGMRAK